MNRRTFLMAVGGATTGCLRSQLPRLNVFNWENYVASRTIPDFEREFRCRVRYGTYGSAEELLAKVMSGNSGWDVVFPSNAFLQPMRELGLLLQLDRSRLPNGRFLEARFQQPEWDPTGGWCRPYMHSATGVVFSTKVRKPPKAWADLWTDQYDRRVTMLDDPAEVLGASLKLAGKSLNAIDVTTLETARDLAIRQKPLLRAYLNEEVRDQVVSGDVLVAQMWAQVAQVAIENSKELAFSFPQEGFALYADNACILKESAHPDLAYQFLNYLLRPSVAAAVCREMRTATTNEAARALLPASDRDNPILYPSDEVLKRGEWFRSLPGAAQQLRDRYWTEIKSA